MNNNISVAPLHEDYLAHHQIKGAKWGVMHGPPYPLARGKGGRLPAVKKTTSAAKLRREEKRAAKAESKAEDKKAALRKQIVEHPNKLYKYKDMFSREELESIINDINFDQKLKDVKRNNFKKTVDTVKDAALFVSSVKTIATSAVDTYKAAQNISDILNKKGAFSKDSGDQKTDKKAEVPKSESSKASTPKEAPTKAEEVKAQRSGSQTKTSTDQKLETISKKADQKQDSLSFFRDLSSSEANFNVLEVPMSSLDKLNIKK